MPTHQTRSLRPARSQRRSVYDLSFAEYVTHLGDDQASTAFRSLYQHRRIDKSVLAAAEALNLQTDPLREVDAQAGSMTTKYLFGLTDGAAVETVKITRRTGQTACVSSQVGCAFQCQFCASGQNGLTRHLSPGEIVQQVLALGSDINRVVFIGIGEPLHNYDNVLAAVRILRDRQGLGLNTRGITISTIGVPDGLRRLREEHMAINLTVSLHATDDTTRHRLIPGARQHQIEDVIARSLSWARRHNRTVTYVYLILPGVNDNDADQTRLAEWFSGQPARINLMRWNPVDGDISFRRANDPTLTRFRDGLVQAHIPTTVRDTQGQDIDAACGQLWARQQIGSPDDPG